MIYWRPSIIGGRTARLDGLPLIGRVPVVGSISPKSQVPAGKNAGWYGLIAPKASPNGAAAPEMSSVRAIVERRPMFAPNRRSARTAPDDRKDVQLGQLKEGTLARRDSHVIMLQARASDGAEGGTRL